MYRPHARDIETAVWPKPATCPFCGSARMTTASEHVDASAYWRCETCGEVWNVGRLQASGRVRSRAR
jgi:transposase-like protein